MILQISSQNLASGLSLLGTTTKGGRCCVQLGNIYVEFICANYLYEILIKVRTMCSKNMNDEEGYDETCWNDTFLRGSMPRSCRRAPGREIERVKNMLDKLLLSLGTAQSWSFVLRWSGSFGHGSCLNTSRLDSYYVSLFFVFVV